MGIRKVSENLWNKYKVVIRIAILVLIMLILSNIKLIKVNVNYAMLSNAIIIVIGLISSTFGIIISVYILAFSLFEKNYSNIAYLKLFGSKEVKLLLSIMSINNRNHDNC